MNRSVLLRCGAMAFLFVVALSAALDQRGPIRPPSLSFKALSSDDCHASGPTRLDGSAVGLSDSPIRMLSNDGLLLHVCSPGILSAVVEATAAQGVGARLVISEGGESLFNRDVTGRLPINVPVPGRGHLLVAFLNDYYRPPADRNIDIYELRFRANR